jgi:hypothetical protein
MTKLSAWKKTCTVFVVCAATAIASPAQTVTILHRFYGAFPHLAVAQPG